MHTYVASLFCENSKITFDVLDDKCRQSHSELKQLLKYLFVKCSYICYKPTHILCGFNICKLHSTTFHQIFSYASNLYPASYMETFYVSFMGYPLYKINFLASIHFKHMRIMLQRRCKYTRAC